MSKTIEKYEALTQESKADISSVIINDSISDYDRTDKKKELSQEKIDSITKNLDAEMKKSFIPIPEAARKKIIEEVEKEAKDTTKTKGNKNDVNISFGGETRLDKFLAYQKKYPESKIDAALDTLGYDKTFTNRFLYTRAKTANSFTKDEESREQFFNQVLSYGSVALFIFLPFFTLFLKFFYIRRKFTYVDHLIFVFHTQTVFFMLFTIFFLLEIFGANPKPWIFLILFLLYLIIAMKQFYKQGYIKTFFKFILLNISYLIIAVFGVSFLFLVSFALF